ncbi:MAG: epoxyqueuosine reductase [Candidatus Omnitrophica bacterium]|nr:epoxyqueuosine reductase [Candidatus Omnitrophota bacterium]
MESVKNYNVLKKYCLGLGADLFGVADIAGIKKDFMLSAPVLEKVNRAVSLGVSLSGGVLGDIKEAPTRLYFHHYRVVNAFLDQLALKVGNYIQKKNYFSLPIPASQIVDWQNQRGHLAHKEVGYLAGLGWIGRNNLLVNKRLGAQLRLVTILTDMPLEPDKPVKEGCKECLVCVTICPAQAIKKGPSDFDYLKCFQKLKDFQKQRLVDQYICGMCVKVCRKK